MMASSFYLVACLVSIDVAVEQLKSVWLCEHANFVSLSSMSNF